MGSEELTGSVLRPGTVLADQYEIIEPLGQGAMGRVYKAKDRKMGRLVAIKIQRMALQHHAKAEVLAQRFVAEVMVPAQVVHPNVIVPYDRGVHNGLLYYVTEYIEGSRDLERVLDDHLDAGEFVPEPQARTYFEQALKALRAVHSVAPGAWHRDVKLQNFLAYEYSGGGDALKLIDFGVAHDPNNELTIDDEGLGTHLYWSPEYFRSGVKLDGRADLYALGVTFYRLLCGTKPYPHVRGLRSMNEEFHGENRRPVKRPSAVRPSLCEGWDRLIFGLMEIELTKRFQTANDALEAFAPH